jgi:hypothetical protein
VSVISHAGYPEQRRRGSPTARFTESCCAASEDRMMPALLPSSTLILDCRAPSDSRMLARFRRSASACFRVFTRRQHQALGWLLKV